MKIVFCGPPHSGKSVFVANLISRLPTDSYTIIRACPDGEGTWSNNKNQKETSIVRKKGKFTESFIDDACNSIDNQTNKIVLVDVGGVMSKENEEVFRHCDSFFVLSSNEQKKKEWLEFGEMLGLECIGCVDSSLEGNEEIYSRKPYIQGKIVGLERGTLLENSKLMEGIVSEIIKKSKYGEKTENLESDEYEGVFIDDTELGFELGYGKEIPTEDGTVIKNVRWCESSLPKIHKAIQEKVIPGKPLKMNGIRANFVLCNICKTAKQHGVRDISAYDIRTGSYIPIRNLPKKRGVDQADGLAYKIIENEDNIFLDIDITKEKYSLEDFERCVLPKIKENKSLYISGRMPLWLLASISNSYDSERIFTFQPGRGFTCVTSKDEKELGKIVDGIDGININQYFEDKKNKSSEKLPVVVEDTGILSKIKKIFKKFRKNSEDSEYLDPTYKANVVTTQTNHPTGNSFQESLQASVSVKTEEISTQSNNIPKEDSKRNIGE